MTDLRQAAQQALEALTYCEAMDRNAEQQKTQAITALRTALAQTVQPAEPCIGKDPRCPCQDGDACHYKDCGSTKASPEQQAEPVADDKVICPACCQQFRAIPTAVQTLMLNAGFEPPFVTPPAAPSEWPLIKNILAEYGLDAIAFVAEWKAAQRPWQGLTDEERKDALVSVDAETKRLPPGMTAFARAIEAKLKERNGY